MLGYKGPAQPSPALGDALNAGYLYLEVRCLGCDTHQTVALDIVRRPKATPIHELERYMRCKDCSQVRGYPVQAEPPGGAAAEQDFRQRSAVDVVAGGEVMAESGQMTSDAMSADWPLTSVGGIPATVSLLIVGDCCKRVTREWAYCL